MRKIRPYYQQKKYLYGKNHILLAELGKESITDTLLKEIENNLSCCVWRVVEESKTESETQKVYDIEMEMSTISQMSLIIIYISKDFFEVDNYILEEICPIIKSNKIPMIPLVEESTEEFLEKYEKIFASTQYVSVGKEFPVEVIKDKIKKKIHETLISAEKYDVIANNLPEKFFLSYRKKERRAALKIMNKIHSHNDLRNIPIWYDDLLTIGEDYNDEIDEKIVECSVFILMITDSVLEEGNYVREIEVPRAISLNKCIVPISMSKDINEEDIKKIFPDIPEILSIDDTKFSDKLLGRIKHTLNNISNRTCEQMYYLGLAYMYGVETERDYKVAFDILKSVAEKGYNASYDRIVYCLLNACGTEKDIDAAVMWQSKIVDLNKRKYMDAKEAGINSKKETKVSEETVSNFVEFLKQISVYYHSLERLKALYFESDDKANEIETVKVMAEVATEWTKSYRPAVKEKVKCYSWLVENCEDKEYYFKYLENTIEDIEFHDGEDKTPNIGSVFLELGKRYEDKGEYEDALTYYEKVLKIELPRFEEYKHAEQNYFVEITIAEIGASIINAYMRKCSLYFKNNRPKEAMGFVRSAADISKEVIEFNASEKYVLLAIRAYYLWYFIAEKTSSINDMSHCTKNIISLAEKIDYKLEGCSHYLVESCVHQGMISFENMDYASMEECIKIIDTVLAENPDLFSDPYCDEVLTKTAILYENIGDKYKDDLEKAVCYYEKSFDIWNRMNDGGISCVWDILLTSEKLYAGYMKIGKWNDAKDIVCKMLQIESEVHDKEIYLNKLIMIANAKKNLVWISIKLEEEDQVEGWINEALETYHFIYETFEEKEIKAFAKQNINVLEDIIKDLDD